MSVPSDAIVGSLLGTAVGDALGMPVEGLSHQNVRTYYKGIKEYRNDDERGDLSAGQWTDDTQTTFALVRALARYSQEPGGWPRAVADEYLELRSRARRWGSTTRTAVDRLADGVDPRASGGGRPTDGAAMRAAPLGAWWCVSDLEQAEVFDVVCRVLGVTHLHPAALAAGWGQVVAIRRCLQTSVGAFDREAYWDELIDATSWAERELDGDNRVSDRLNLLSDHLDTFPLDLRDLCDGVGVRADEAWPFACAMVARRPHLLENTLLSGINVGGDADTTGAMMGAMLGALHGWSSFPNEWRTGLEASGQLETEARAFYDAIALRG